uniref:Uncharacterized protein n=1 Tax=Arundo donax TaxID=35708 RepID=A0A0A9AYU0_ARUDO
MFMVINLLVAVRVSFSVISYSPNTRRVTWCMLLEEHEFALASTTFVQ